MPWNAALGVLGRFTAQPDEGAVVEDPADRHAALNSALQVALAVVLPDLAPTEWRRTCSPVGAVVMTMASPLGCVSTHHSAMTAARNALPDTGG
jgi:hypothetical protein